MLFAYPWCFFLSLNSNIDWEIREIFRDWRKSEKEFALIKVVIESKVLITREQSEHYWPNVSSICDPSPDTFPPTFQRPSTRFGNDLSRETSASSGDSMLLISLRALDFRVCHWQWTNLWTIIGDESSDSILLNLSWCRLRTSISGTHFEGSFSEGNGIPTLQPSQRGVQTLRQRDSQSSAASSKGHISGIVSPSIPLHGVSRDSLLVNIID